MMVVANNTELEIFMAAIRRLESGSFAGDYSVAKESLRHSTLGIPLGAYQIMSANWGPWSREAGIAGADWRDPTAQDFVARYKFKQYYEQYGDWRLVAIAWFAGPGGANKAARDGLASLSNTSDMLGTSVPKYVELIDKYMGEYASTAGYNYSPSAQAEPGFLPGDREAIERAGAKVPGTTPPRPSAQTVMAQRASQGAKAGSPAALGATPLDITDPSLTMRANLRSLLIGISDAVKARTTNPLLVDNPLVLGESDEDEDEEIGLI